MTMNACLGCGRSSTQRFESWLLLILAWMPRQRCGRRSRAVYCPSSVRTAYLNVCIDDAGPFKVFCDNLQPSNMLVDTDNSPYLRSSSISSSQPLWQPLLGPDIWLERYIIEKFLPRYVPKMEQFLRALKRIEAKSVSIGGGPNEPRLFTEMRYSWKTRRFWFNYAARKSLDVDFILLERVA